jgi:hypothetical protein
LRCLVAEGLAAAAVVGIVAPGRGPAGVGGT